MIRITWIKLVLSICTIIISFVVVAQTYPERPITIIVPFTPGGVSDINGLADVATH